jgi:4-amino-4-deoxy-L-arabinose transferase-like glycosyltransferase
VTEPSRATTAVRVAVWSFATLVVVEATLGAAGALRAAAPALLALGLVAVAARIALRKRFARSEARPPLTAADVGLAGALVAALAIRLQAGLHKRLFLYDALSYHLHVPATWLASGRLGIVPAVFGDPSSAYAPSNLELWFAFLMAPLHSDYLASAGQLPFAALGALAIAAAAREAGVRREAALGGALVFLLVPEVWQQARTAMTDLGMASLLLAALPFVFRLRQQARAADLLAAVAALGLAIGTKYAAAPLALPFLVAVVWAARRARFGAPVLAAAALTLLATGGFWYVRNLIVTGNPWYPVATLGLPGLYDRVTMRAWDYHLPIADLAPLAEMLGGAGVGFGAAAVAGFARVRPPLEAALALVVVAIFWFVVPYQESRFLMAGFGLAALAIGRAADRAPAALGWGGLGVAIIGELLELPSPDRLWPLPIALLAAAGAHLWRRMPPRARRPAAWTAALAATVLVVAGTSRGLGAHRRGADPYRLGGDLDEAWAWFGANVHGARVAYTGTNLAFPLWGPDLGNRVTYVNVAGEPGDHLHDFARRLPPGWRAPTAEPAPYRDGASYDVWLRNLRAARADVLFVAAAAEQFPVERDWADAHADLFQLRFASPAARVYRVVGP